MLVQARTLLAIFLGNTEHLGHRVERHQAGDVGDEVDPPFVERALDDTVRRWRGN